MVAVTIAQPFVPVATSPFAPFNIAKIDEVNDVRIRSYPCPKVNDAGLVESWSKAQIASVVISAAATYVAYKTAKDQYDIANRYWKLARDEWDFFYDTYRPLEEKELDEIWAEGEIAADHSGSVDGHTSSVDNLADKSLQHRKQIADKYCLCPDVGSIRQMYISESTVYGDLANFARRRAENQATLRNDRRRNRKLAAANRGRDMLSSSTGFAAKANAEYSDYAETMSGLATGAAEFASYLGNRNPTKYNGQRNRVNNRFMGAGEYGSIYTNGSQFSNTDIYGSNPYTLSYDNLYTSPMGTGSMDGMGATSYMDDLGSYGITGYGEGTETY